MNFSSMVVEKVAPSYFPGFLALVEGEASFSSEAIQLSHPIDGDMSEPNFQDDADVNRKRLVPRGLSRDYL